MSCAKTTKMSQNSNSALVLWLKSKQTSVVPQEAFVKTFAEDGKEGPLCEGAVRAVAVSDKTYEAKVLRISASKKFLESLLVTKDGKVLMHGTKPSTCDILAKRSHLFSDETDGQKKERKVLWNLNRNAEEHQPNIRLPSSGCSHGCPSCCSGTLPPFPTIPEGFISTVVSLAQYFKQFHQSTIANILAAGHTIDKGEPDPWRVKSDQKMEVILGSDIWINTKVFERIVLQVDTSKKPPQQALVKNLLTHLMGVEKYIETPAEKIDKRLISAVVEFVNERYGETTQPTDRFNRCINLNRAYMQKRKNEGLLDDSYLTVKYFDGPSKFDGTREERNKLLAEIEAKKRKSNPSFGIIPATADTNARMYGSANQLMIPLHNENSEDVVQAAPAGSNTNKIIVVRRPVTTLSSSENIPQSPAVVASNYQTSGTTLSSLPTFANRSMGAPGNRSILVQSPQASSNNIVAVTTDRPIGAMSQMMSLNSPSVPVGFVRSVPVQNQPSPLANSMTTVKPGSLTPTNSSRPVIVASRPATTAAPQPGRGPAIRTQHISTSNGLITFPQPTVARPIAPASALPPPARAQPLPFTFTTSQQAVPRPITAALASKGKALPASSGRPTIQVTRTQSQPVRVSGPSQSKASKISSPEIIDLLDDNQVFAPPKKSIKLEQNVEIEGALNFEL